MKYYNKKQPHIVCTVIDLMAAGFGSVIGTTFVLFKYKEDEIHRVMEHKEFHATYEKI